jgi:uncharacterized membrane protein
MSMCIQGFLLFFMLLVMQETQPEAQPEITVDVGAAEPNQVVIIRVTVFNPGTADLLWNNTVRIEEVHPNLVPVKSEHTLPEKIKPGEVAIGEVSVQVKPEAESGVYPVVISLSGGVGTCEEGCIPYFIEKEVVITVIRESVEVKVTYTVSDSVIKVTIRNTGTTKVHSVECNGEPLGTLSPGETEDITIDTTDKFTVSYQDKYGKKISQSYQVKKPTTTPPPEPETDIPVPSVLVGTGILLGYVLKRRQD